MPVEARWLDDERQIVIYEFVGQWSIEELRVTFAAERAMIAESLRPIAYINDYSLSTRIPLDVVLRAREFIPMMDTAIPTYIVHADTIVRFMAEAVLRLLPSLSIRFASSLEEARRMIAADLQDPVAVQQEPQQNSKG